MDTMIALLLIGLITYSNDFARPLDGRELFTISPPPSSFTASMALSLSRSLSLHGALLVLHRRRRRRGHFLTASPSGQPIKARGRRGTNVIPCRTFVIVIIPPIHAPLRCPMKILLFSSLISSLPPHQGFPVIKLLIVSKGCVSLHPPSSN